MMLSRLLFIFCSTTLPSTLALPQKLFFEFFRWGFGLSLSEGGPLAFGVGNKGSERNLDPSLFGRR